MSSTRLGPGGYPIAALAGGASALAQFHSRFRTDADAVDGAPTWGAAEDGNDFDPGIANFRLRFGINNLGDDFDGTYELRMSKNGGAYAPITTSSTGGVISADAGASADDADLTVQRLSSP